MITPKPKRILVPTDFSENAGYAMRYASDLASRLGAGLAVLYSDPFLPPIDYTATVGGWDESSFANLKARAEEQLERDAETNINPSVLYDAMVRVDTPLDGILAQARESGAGLIVMGTHGRSGFRRLVIGSVTEAVMHHAEVPVLAIPPRSTATASIKRIVCSVTYNAQCFDALTFAAQIARPEARFILIRARSTDLAQSEDDLFNLSAWVPDSIATRCDFELFGSGSVPEQIDAFARKTQADLIVASEPAERTALDVLRGTFAARLAQQSDCPVLTLNAAATQIAKPEAWQAERTDFVGAMQ